MPQPNPWATGRPKKRLNADLVAKLKLSYVRKSEIRVVGDDDNPAIDELIAQGRLYAKRHGKSFRHRFDVVDGVPYFVFRLVDKRQYTMTADYWRNRGVN